MLDLGQLLPHSKRDSKLDTKSERGVINEVADMKVRGRQKPWLGLRGKPEGESSRPARLRHISCSLLVCEEPHLLRILSRELDPAAVWDRHMSWRHETTHSCRACSSET